MNMVVATVSPCPTVPTRANKLGLPETGSASVGAGSGLGDGKNLTKQLRGNNKPLTLANMMLTSATLPPPPPDAELVKSLRPSSAREQRKLRQSSSSPTPASKREGLQRQESWTGRMRSKMQMSFKFEKTPSQRKLQLPTGPLLKSLTRSRSVDASTRHQHQSVNANSPARSSRAVDLRVESLNARRLSLSRELERSTQSHEMLSERVHAVKSLSIEERLSSSAKISSLETELAAETTREKGLRGRGNIMSWNSIQSIRNLAQVLDDDPLEDEEEMMAETYWSVHQQTEIMERKKKALHRRLREVRNARKECPIRPGDGNGTTTTPTTELVDFVKASESMERMDKLVTMVASILVGGQRFKTKKEKRARRDRRKSNQSEVFTPTTTTSNNGNNKKRSARRSQSMGHGSSSSSSSSGVDMGGVGSSSSKGKKKNSETTPGRLEYSRGSTSRSPILQKIERREGTVRYLQAELAYVTTRVDNFEANRMLKKARAYSVMNECCQNIVSRKRRYIRLLNFGRGATIDMAITLALHGERMDRMIRQILNVHVDEVDMSHQFHQVRNRAVANGCNKDRPFLRCARLPIPKPYDMCVPCLSSEDYFEF